MVDRDSVLSVSHQCALLGISRNVFYYKPQASQETLLLMRLMDDIFTDDMTAGQRKIRRALWNRYGVRAGRDRIRTLMERMNIRPICPKPDLSFPKRDDHKFPYLLHGVKITHANQVWSTDITYVRLKEGFCYLTAVIDWYSRRILSWRLSNTLSAVFCIECVNEAFGKYGRPEIFNTDQGSQYTSQDFTSLFEARDKEGHLLTRLSMDSKGRAYDNIYIERFWKTIKYEDIYLKGYGTMKECRAGIAEFICRYNDRREHSSLDGHAPSDVYFKRVTLRKVA